MKKNISGLILTALITGFAFLSAQIPFLQKVNLSALTLAVLFGIVIGNTFYPKIEATCQSGVLFAKGFLLRAGIVLYGFRLTLQDINLVGLNAVLTDTLLLVSTFIITCLIGIKYLKIDRQVVHLTAAGCSICGAAAIMAASSTLNANSHKVSVSVALIVLFGTLSMFVYPMLYPYLINYIDNHQFGIYAGSTIHEVAQVYAAGGNINEAVANTAVISKMIRVMMLAPFLLWLSYYVSRSEQQQQNKLVIPYFALLFIAVAVFNSFNLLPKEWVAFLVETDTLLLMMAMSALGLTTNLAAIKQTGIKPLILGASVWLWLVIGGFAINLIMYRIWP